MKEKNLVLAIILTTLLGLPVYTIASTVQFELLTSTDNIGTLPQQQQNGGDYLPRTGDDITGGSINPDGSFSFNYMNPDGTTEPASYAKSTHSMAGSLVLDINLQVGGTVDIISLEFDGYVSPGKFSAQHLDNGTNSGTYSPTAASNWAFQACFDWYYDTPFAGSGTTDMAFDNYQWSGFIIPVSELTTSGMAVTTLDDSLGYFDDNFGSWLLNQIAPQLPQEAAYLFFAQGQANPSWTHPMMDMDTDGIVGETIIAYAVPEPATAMLLVAGFCCASGLRRRSKNV
ncbi:MAG: PEP-CTERM sorting domain-containing protein [Planctomycetota bacterium]